CTERVWRGLKCRERGRGVGKRFRTVAQAPQTLGGYRAQRLFVLHQHHALALPALERTLVLILGGGRRIDARQIGREGAAAARCARDVDRAGGIGDDAVDERQSESGALANFLGCEERLEYAAQRRLVHAYAVVADGEPRVRAAVQGAAGDGAVGV